MNGPDISIFGAGGHAKTAIETARKVNSLKVAGVFDDGLSLSQKNVLGAPVLGPIEEDAVRRHGVECAIIAIGANGARQRIAQRFDALLTWVTLVHPRAYVADDVRLGDGTLVAAGAVVQPSTTVGRHVILNTSCSVDHDCRIGDFAHVAPGCRLAGGVTVGEGALIGIGATVIPGITIGEWATVGAGSVVVRDVPAHATVKGNPAHRG